MKLSTVIRLIGLTLCCAAVMASPLRAENTAKGKLTVGEKAVEIMHAYAYKQELMNRDGTVHKTNIITVPCDVPVTGEAAQGKTADLEKMVQAGKAHCVEATVEYKTREMGYQVLHNGFPYRVSPIPGDRNNPQDNQPVLW